MSYFSPVGGSAGFGGFGYAGLGADFPVREEDSDMQSLQQQLQRLGYLQAGAGIFGADGKFGPRTATALRGAASYVGWTGAVYTPTNADRLQSGTVSIPDDLIRRIEAGRPNPQAPHYAAPQRPEEGGLVEPGATTIGPALDPKIDIATGRPVEVPGSRYESGSAVVSPGPLGAHNWPSMSFNPETGLAYIPTIHQRYKYEDAETDLRGWTSPDWLSSAPSEGFGVDIELAGHRKDGPTNYK